MSFTTTNNCFLRCPALLSASNARPPVNAPSPIILTTLNFSLSKSLAHAIPSPAEIEVDAWPAPNTSNSLSVLFKKPLNPLYFLIVLKESNLPVKTLCA